MSDKRGFKTLYEVVKQAGYQWNEDNAPRFAASVAFFTIFSIAPLLTIVVAVAGVVFGDAAARAALIEEIERLSGSGNAKAVETILEHAEFSAGDIITTIAAVLIMLWGATRVFAELQEAMNHIWNVTPRIDSMVLGLLWKRTLSFVMILAVGFLLLVSLVMSALLSAFESQMAEVIPSGAMRILMWSADNAISFGLITLLVAMIYKILPDAEIAWRDVWLGAVVTAALFVIGKYLIGLYLGRSTTASAFGAAGSFMVFLIWIFFSVQILFFGAELTQVVANRYGSGVLPIKGAQIKEKGKST
ncbi:MAG: YihY/virulence factor BrkB family protein [Desulfobacterales bacterium]